MNLDTLRIFCDVVRHRSFSRGAAAGGISQSAATQAVRRLEEHFGLQLFDRSKRPFVLTPEGQVCFDGFSELLERYEAVEVRIRSMGREVSGSVRVAAIYSVGLHQMSLCMQQFMRRYPQARVRLEYLRPDNVINAVLDGQADLGLISYPRPSAQLQTIPWRSERMVLACHLQHALAGRESVRIPELHGLDFVSFDHDLRIRKYIDRYLRQFGVRVNTVLEFDNIETIKQAVEIGAGVSILPEPTVQREVERGTLVSIGLDPPELLRPVGIIYRQRRPFTPPLARFVELLHELSDSPVQQAPRAEEDQRDA